MGSSVQAAAMGRHTVSGASRQSHMEETTLPTSSQEKTVFEFFLLKRTLPAPGPVTGRVPPEQP